MVHFVDCKLKFRVALEDAQCSPSNLARAILDLLPKEERVPDSVGPADCMTVYVTRIAGQTIVTSGDKKPRATVTFVEES